MSQEDQINTLLKDVMARLGGIGQQGGGSTGSAASQSICDAIKNNLTNVTITPSQLLVIAGILGGVLSVDSVLVDKSQEIQIVLIGSLKRKSELEKIMDQVGQMPFDEVVKTMLGRLM